MSSTENVDVLIAGAGPAGTIAATILARAGTRVMVVDRARFPRDKLCGDTLNPGALAILQRLGVADRVEQQGLRLNGMILTGERGVRVQGVNSIYPDQRYGRAIVRRELDAALLSSAIEAGARFDEGVMVRGPLMLDGSMGPQVGGLLVAGRDGRSLRLPAAVTIAADGRRSAVAFSLSLIRHPPAPRRWAVGGYFQSVDGLSSFGEMHVRRGHYIGVAPLPGDLANVCLVSKPHRQLADPRQLLHDAIDSDPQLRDRFAGARLVGPLTSMGPLAVDGTSAGMPGLLLAGDAAGFIDPITGDGVRLAMRGGELAARAALAMLSSSSLNGHERLARWRAEEFGRKWRFNRALRRLVGSDLGVRLASVCAARAPRILRKVIMVAGDL